MTQPSRTIRLFVSSTFSDLKAERNALQEKVFPRLKQLCLSKGLRFQAIDLRWGISEEAGRDNRTMRICLRELKRCQEGRPKPHFLILLGDRYGWRPLPETIPASLFERLEAQVRSTDAGLADLLGRRYRRDDNAVPPIYELLPRETPYDEDFEHWQREVEWPLLESLTGAAKAAGVDLDAAGISIGVSATEQEIIQGALKVSDARDHVRAFFRTIDGLPESPPPKDYVDLGPDGRRDAQAAAKLDALKSRISGHIGSENVYEYRAAWAETGKTLQVWDLETGECLRTLEGHGGRILGVSVTPDGRWAVSASYDRTLRVWNLATGASLRTLEGHNDDVMSVSVTPDGRRAISGSGDLTLRVWDLESGACPRTLEGHRGLVSRVTVTPDGRQAISASHDKTLRLWDVATGECLRTLEGHSHLVNSVSVTPDGRRAISASHDKTLRLWDVATGECIRTLEGHSDVVTAVNMTPDGRRAVSASWDKTVRVWDLAAGECVQMLVGHNDWVMSVSVTPDGRRAIFASGGETLGVRDLESDAGLQMLEGHSSWVEGVSVTPDGRRAVFATGSLVSTNHTLRVWDLVKGLCLRMAEGHTDFVTRARGRRRARQRGHTDFINEVIVTPDGRRAVSASWDETLRVWDMESGACLALFLARARVSSVAISTSRVSIVLGTITGEVLFLESRGIAEGPAVLTLSRFLSRAGATGTSHATRCPSCGVEFEPAPGLVSAVESLSSHLAPEQSPCLDLPDVAFADPRLVSTCPHCAQAIKFNPFFVDMR